MSEILPPIYPPGTELRLLSGADLKWIEGYRAGWNRCGITPLHQRNNDVDWYRRKVARVAGFETAGDGIPDDYIWWEDEWPERSFVYGFIEGFCNREKHDRESGSAAP